jgi:hypothetical protein
VSAAEAAAAVVSFDGRLLSYRAQPDEQIGVKLDVEPSTTPSHLWVGSSTPLDVAFGCDADVRAPAVDGDYFVTRCPFAPLEPSELRYDLSLSGADDIFFGTFRLRGTVHGGAGSDELWATDIAYGGGGADMIDDARRGYGGPGDDDIMAGSVAREPNIVRGGPGNDRLHGPGWLYGGPGDDDFLDDEYVGMFVGGPGRDTVALLNGGVDEPDVARVRGGGRDRVLCPETPRPDDLLFVDPSDRLDPSCRRARVVVHGRPARLRPVAEKFGEKDAADP